MRMTNTKRKVKLRYKLIIFVVVAFAFWMRFHYCEHPILNPDKDATAQIPSATETENGKSN